MTGRTCIRFGSGPTCAPLYCVPFATSLLRDVAPGFCAALGASYVVIVTVSYL